MAKWQRVKITLNRQAEEAAFAILQQEGISGVEIEDPLLMLKAQEEGWGDYFPETAFSDKVAIIYYLPEEGYLQKSERIHQRIANLTGFGLETGPLEITVNPVWEEDWAEAWKRHFHPQRIGRIIIQPSWLPFEEEDEGLLIRLDPGMAFGSGAHPTTAMCIRLLQEMGLQGKEVWDVGSGSGILALVSEKLGARVQAVDTDPLSVQVALANRDFNNLSFSVSLGSLEQLDGNPQVIVANIIADVIGPLLPLAYDRLSPGGFFLGAGIIHSRGREIANLARRAGFQLVQKLREGEWLTFLWEKV